MSKLYLNFKILGKILVGDTGGWVSHLSMSRLNLYFKILGEILVGNYGGSIILGTCPSSKFATSC